MSGWQTLVASDTLAIALGRPDLIVVDCRHRLADPGYGRHLWLEGHIPGAVHAHLDLDLSDTTHQGEGRHPLPDEQRFCATLAAWGITPEHQVVAYDERDGSMAAARLWFLLRLFGHQKVAVLDGGYTRWTSQGKSIGNRPIPRVQGEYRARFDRSRILDAGEVLRRLDDPPGWLIDARAAERFRGEIEPIDPRAGHVPGAVNRPYTENLQADGRFRSPVELAAAFRELCGERDLASMAVMCGSGVTACHHLLAMERAGFRGVKLFAGGWSGWLADPARPIATGA